MAYLPTWNVGGAPNQIADRIATNQSILDVAEALNNLEGSFRGT